MFLHRSAIVTDTHVGGEEAFKEVEIAFFLAQTISEKIYAIIFCFKCRRYGA